jgi:predicted DNA-binding transcriptional regulator YafY
MSESLDRTKRSLDLIPYILEHQGIPLDDLARKFNISTDVLYEDLNLLFCCGLPGYTPLELIDITFDDGIVSVSEPQALDVPRKLSKEELLRLHLGLELCAKFAPKNLEAKITNLQQQISDLMTLNAPIEIVKGEDQGKIETILKAITSKMTLKFIYASAKSDSLMEREILPHSLSEDLNKIYVEGFELDSERDKSFRIDRMSNLSIGRNMPAMSEKKGTVSAGTPIKLKIHHSAQNFLIENSAIILESHNQDYGYEVLLRDISEAWVVSEVFANGGAIEVLEPITLKRHIGELAKSRLAKL